MKRDLDTAIAQPPALSAKASAPLLACVLATLAIVALHWETAASIVSIWWRSETYAHGFVVIPIALWFVWRKRAELAATPAHPWWPGLFVVAAAGVLWLVASAADALGAKQFALAFMLQGAIVTIVGLRVARLLAFPLAFLLFAVPTGEFLIPTLIDWTADFTVLALQLTGIPVYRQGNNFYIPSGRWSVVEACSGVRYIIASLMVGTIFAAIAYRSPKRRALFVLAAIIVPVLANWFRAYMIVMIGHLSNNRLAVGVDHILYGWLFFGLVMLVLFWIGSFWQEPAAARPAMALPASPDFVAASPAARPAFAAAIAAILVASLCLPLDARTGRGAVHPPPELPAIAGTGGWVATSTAIADWRPKYGGYAADYRQSYRKAEADVGLHIVYYRDQVKGAELITSVNMLAPKEGLDWLELAEGVADVEWSGRPLAVRRAELHSRAASIEVFYLYRVDGRETSSPYIAKALLAWSRLKGRGDDAALITFYAPVAGVSGEVARQSLRAFAQAMSPSIDRALAAGEASGR